MAQATRSKSKPATGSNASRARSSGSTKGAASRRSSSAAKRTGSAGRGAKSKSTNASRRRSQPRSAAQSRNGAEAIKQTAIENTKAAGHTVADAVSKAKGPLIAGGTALAGVAAGALIRDRLAANRSQGPLKRLRGASMPRPGANLDPRRLDLDKVKSVADRVSAYGQQASDIAAAAEKTRKKHS